MLLAFPTKTSGEKSFIAEDFSTCNFIYVYDTKKEIGWVYTNTYVDNGGLKSMELIEFFATKRIDAVISNPLKKSLIHSFKKHQILVYIATPEIVKDQISAFYDKSLKEME